MIYDAESEARVLGTAIAAEKHRDRIFASVTADCFYDVGHRRVFEWLLGRFLLGTLPADDRTVFSEMMREGVLSKADLPSYFYETDAVRPLIDRVRSYSAARTLQGATKRALDAVEVNPLAAAELIADTRQALDEVPDAAGAGEHLWTWDELSEENHPADWIIPDLIEREWVVMVTGPNGGGKSTLCLQFALGAACGVHPWTAKEIEPRRVLVIDAENSAGVVARKKRIAGRMVSLGGADESAENIRFRFGPVNLADPADRLRLEHHFQSFRPDLVVLGPIYKLYSSGGDSSWRSEAVAVQTWVDKVRRRYGFAVLIEAHAPKGEGNGAPKGDSSWASWPYFGFFVSLNEHTRSVAELTPWRYPREPVQMPESIRWGSEHYDPVERLLWTPQGRLISSEEW